MTRPLLISVTLHLLVILAAMGARVAPWQEVRLTGIASLSLQTSPEVSTEPESSAMDMPRVAPAGQISQQRPELPEMPPEPPAETRSRPGIGEPAPDVAHESSAENDPARTFLRPLFRKATVGHAAETPGREPDPAPAESASRAADPASGQSAEPVAPSGPLSSAQCDKAPAILEVEWPRRLRRTFQGTVTIRVEVSADGAARRVDLVRGTGRDDFDRQLIEAMRAATYRAAVKDGQRVACIHQFRVEFATE